MNSSKILFAVLPKSVEQLSKQLNSNIVDSSTLKTLIDLSTRYWKGENIKHSEWEAISKSSYLPLSMLEELFSGILTLTMAVFRIPAEKSHSKETLCDELTQLGLSVEQAEYIIKLTSFSGPKLPCFLKVNNVKWRIDITISTSNVSRILEPWVLLELEFSTGESKTIHIPIAQFHNLRYQVAYCLNELKKM